LQTIVRALKLSVKAPNTSPTLFFIRRVFGWPAGNKLNVVELVTEQDLVPLLTRQLSDCDIIATVSELAGEMVKARKSEKSFY